jgi:hypothetical protein
VAYHRPRFCCSAVASSTCTIAAHLLQQTCNRPATESCRPRFSASW